MYFCTLANNWIVFIILKLKYLYNSFKESLYYFIYRSKSDIEKYREEKEITLVGENIPKPIFKFDESGFPDIIIKELK